MTERERLRAIELERDRLYAEHMMRLENERGDWGWKQGDPRRLQSKPGLFESLVLWMLG